MEAAKKKGVSKVGRPETPQHRAATTPQKGKEMIPNKAKDCQSLARDYFCKPANRYSTDRNRIPTKTTVGAFLESAKAQLTPLQQRLIDEPSKEKRRELKHQLPFWQLQSAPTKRGADAAIEAEQNGIFALDIDAAEGKRIDLDAATKAAQAHKSALAVLRTASGRGAAILIAVSKELAAPWEADPDIPKTGAALNAAQEIVFREAESAFKLPVDMSANNADRGRYQCCALLWKRDDNDPVTPWESFEALERIKERLGIVSEQPDQEQDDQPDQDDETFFDTHPISKLARAYQGDARAGSMGTAAAIATAAALVDVRTDVHGDIHSARARVVVLAYSGAGKTGICDAMAGICDPHGVIFTNPKTTARLREDIRRAGTTTETDENGEKNIKPKQHADHILCIIDEAGDRMSQRAQDPNGLDLLGFFRELHGGFVLLEGLKDAPSIRVPACFTGILWSTPDQYAKYASRITGSDGEARRVLEFIEPKPENAKTPEEAIARRSRRRGNEFIIAEIADQIAIRFTEHGEIIRATEEAIRASGGIYSALINSGLDEGSAISLIFNYSAFIAAVRIAMQNAERAEITPEDIRATAAILRATAIRARAQLHELEEREDDRRYKPENEVWAAIRDRIQSGNDRADKMKAWLINRPPIYAQTYADMQARGEIVAERDGKKYRLRFTNAAERTTQQAKTEPPSVWNGQTQGKRGKEYKECDQDEKLERLAKYRAAHEKAYPIEEGKRNNSLRKLRGKLGAAGMWDDTAQGWFFDVCREVGMGQKEAKDLARQGGLTA